MTIRQTKVYDERIVTYEVRDEPWVYNARGRDPIDPQTVTIRLWTAPRWGIRMTIQVEGIRTEGERRRGTRTSRLWESQDVANAPANFLALAEVHRRQLSEVPRG